MTPDSGRLAVFSVAALALLLVPGPAVLYVVARSIQQGRRAGLASVLGIHVGTLVHIAAATRASRRSSSRQPSPSLP